MKKLLLAIAGSTLISTSVWAEEKETPCPVVEHEIGFEISVDHYGAAGLSAAISKAKEDYQAALKTLKSEAKKVGVTLGRAKSDDYSHTTYESENIAQYDIDYTARFKVESGGDKLEKLYVALADKGILANASQSIYTHSCED